MAGRKKKELSITPCNNKNEHLWTRRLSKFPDECKGDLKWIIQQYENLIDEFMEALKK